MIYFRYKIQVRDQYTYRDGGHELDRLVRDLLAEGVGYEGDLAEARRLLLQAKGEKVPEPPKCKPVPPGKVRITVEVVPPPKPPEKEKWRKVPSRKGKAK